MGMHEAPDGVVDTYGLPEYKVSEMQIEIDGHDIRMVLGTKRFGQVQWLYTVVISPEKLLAFTRECQSVAEQAFNIGQIMGKHSH